MGYFLRLSGYAPSGRDDGLKWIEAALYEAPDAAGQPGAWTQIDLFALADYADPLAPPSYSFTTVNATAEGGMWYRIEFRDAIGGTQPSRPEFNGLGAVPTVEEIRADSRADFDELGYPAPVLSADLDPLQGRLDEATTQFYGVTGIDPRSLPVTDKRLPLVRMAIRMGVEYLAASGQMEQLETASDYDMLSAMSASDYSETRRGVTAPNPHVLHPWPALNRLLNLVIYFDTQGGATEGQPLVGAARSVEEVRADMREDSRVPPRWPRPFIEGVPYWPQPWVSNENVGGP